MSNLTLSIDDEIIKQAKLRAVQEGTSLSAQVRDYLQRYAHRKDQATAPDLSFAENALLFTRQVSDPGVLGATLDPAPTRPDGLSVDPDYLRSIRGWAREDAYDHPARHSARPPKST
jgi:plasmid stability protein